MAGRQRPGSRRTARLAAAMGPAGRGGSLSLRMEGRKRRERRRGEKREQLWLGAASPAPGAAAWNEAALGGADGFEGLESGRRGVER
eukprot:749333-Hanusia_phi.AAC.3